MRQAIVNVKNCYRCPFRLSEMMKGYCSHSKFGHRDFVPGEWVDKEFPEWCPLEDIDNEQNKQ
jgi:hypothetical protein